MPGTADDRRSFNSDNAPRIARSLGFFERSTAGRSDRFAYFEDAEQFLLVAGTQERDKVELALAYGLAWAGNRRLVLALPREYSFATQQRLGWLRPSRRPELWLHDGTHVELVDDVSSETAVARLVERLGGTTVADDFRRAGSTLHLGPRSEALDELVDWAARLEDLDPAHRQGERSWHCMGQRVLSLRRGRRSLRVLAGIHGTTDERAPTTLEVPDGARLDGGALAAVRAAVFTGIEARLRPGDPALHRPDEHWLQSVLRRRPDLVGVEQPALREVPAWRPRDLPEAWGRGFVDLIGLDGHGDVRLVETKLSSNDDALLVLQALDYLTWAHAYREPLLDRLGASTDARLRLHLVVGAVPGAAPAISRYSIPLLQALDEDVPWSLQAVEDWFGTDARPRAVVLPDRTLPGDWGAAASSPTGNPYQEASRATAARWKASTSVLPDAARAPAPWHGGDALREYGFCVPKEYAEHNLLPEIRQDALSLFRELEIPWHRGVDGGPGNHLLSSQVQCVNALALMVRDPDRLQRAFRSVVDVATPLPIEGDRYLTFEFIGSTDVLGESRGNRRTRGANNTSVDAAFRYETSSGVVELALVEWKFTEEYRRGRPLRLVGDLTREQRYLPLWNAPDGPLRTDVIPFEDMLAEPFYQLMRQQLLAWGLERRRELGADVVRVLHVLPPDNDAYQQSLTRDSHRRAGGTVDEVWSTLLRRPDRFRHVTPAVFLDPAVTSEEYVTRYGK